MQRALMQKLIQWKDSPRRKPLILQGVRQVGKTWLLKEFGAQHYKNVAYFNFDQFPDYAQLFETTKDPARLIDQLSLLSETNIEPDGETLIIFDEIQDCSNVINSLKYFCEQAPDYHVVSAGSLLGIALAKPSSFPVGKVNFLSLYPLTFTEFLIAAGKENLVQFMDSTDSLSPIPDAFFNLLVEQLRAYFIVGGMPEAVYLWTQHGDIEGVEETLRDILHAYEQDFAKHPDQKEFPKITRVWNSIPSQLSRENKKFLYSVAKEGARAREYEDAVEWLVNANLVHKVFRSSAPRLPLSSYDDLSAFKLYLNDVGLLRKLSGLAPTAFSDGNSLFTEFKGAFTENFVHQSLIPSLENETRYWSQLNPSYEVDFLIQVDNTVVPIEVKADQNLTARSLKKFGELFSDDIDLKVHFSLANLTLDGNVLNIPLFMADHATRLINIARARLGTQLP